MTGVGTHSIALLRLRRIYAWPCALSLLLLAVYWPGLGGGFVFDDYPNIVDNIPLHVTFGSTWGQWLAAMFSSPSSDLQRPLAMLSFAANHAATGLDPFWMKLTNVLIHVVNAWLVFALLRTLLQFHDDGTEAQVSSDRRAAWIAALWALNPINLMAVLFVVQRMESLSHTFVFAGLWLYLIGRARLRRDGRGWMLMLGGLVAGTVAGVLVKESAALLPLYALALEWAVLRFKGNGARPQRRLQALFAALLVVPGLAVLAWQVPKLLHGGGYAGRNFSMGERLLTEGRVLVDYLHWTVLPDLNALSLYHDDYTISRGWWSPASTSLSFALLALLFAGMFWLRKRRPLMALGLAWFFAAHLITGTVLPLELVYEHRNYFASLGVCLVLGDVLLAIPQTRDHRRIGMLLAASLLAFYAVTTALRAREWHDVQRFAASEALKHPASPRASYDLARDYIILSGYRLDSPYIKPAHEALDRALRVPGAGTPPVTAAILFAARTGQPIQTAWWRALQEDLREHPIGPQQYSSLSSLVDCEVKYSCHLPAMEMERTFASALAKGPKAEVLNIYGNYALNVSKNPALALALWRAAAQRAPNVVAYQATLAKMLIAMGQPEGAQVPIARIRGLGRLGQNEALAADLERLASQASSRTHTGETTPP